MRIHRITVSVAAAVLAVTAGASVATARPAATQHRCAVTTRSDQAMCYVIWKPAGRDAAPAGLSAQQIQNAYRLPVGRNPHATVAIVDAYNTPGLASYLAAYRARYKLGGCTTGNGCLRIVNQDGKSGPLPTGSGFGWDLETTLDADMVSVACPRCKILLVEANSDYLNDLATAERTAARLGAVAISNSYGAAENGLADAFASSYNLKGHTVVDSAGDYGYGQANFPANQANVIAVGGTELTKAGNARGWTERVWNTPNVGAGASGCSAYVAKPAWQRALRGKTDCPFRTVADVSAVAWNIAIYEKTYGGWLTVGGTSAAAPLIAGVYALAGNATTVTPAYTYARAHSLFDITQGTNDYLGQTGAVCGGDYLCVAKPGYDAPTGLGTPDGLGAF